MNDSEKELIKFMTNRNELWSYMKATHNTNNTMYKKLLEEFDIKIRVLTECIKENEY